MPAAGVKSNRGQVVRTSFEELPANFMSKTSPSGLSTSYNLPYKNDWNI